MRIKHCIKRKDSSREVKGMHCLKKKPRPRPPRTLEVQEVVQQIARLTLELLPQNEKENLSETRLEFYIKKIVLDILDYCHIEYFPEALVYSAVDLIVKRIKDEASNYVESSETSIISSNAPLKKIKQDDTEYEWAVNNADLSGCLADLDFESIKAKLNLYRRLVAW